MLARVSWSFSPDAATTNSNAALQRAKADSGTICMDRVLATVATAGSAASPTSAVIIRLSVRPASVFVSSAWSAPSTCRFSYFEEEAL